MRARSRAEWMERLEAAGIPCAPIHTLPELAEQEQTDAVAMLQEAPGLAKPFVGLPIKFDDVRPPIRRRAVRPGTTSSGSGTRRGRSGTDGRG